MMRYQSESLFPTEPTQHDISGHIIRVAFESGADSEFDYLVGEPLWPIDVGQRVEAPFGRNNKPQVGFCVEADIAQKDSFAAGRTSRTLKVVTKILEPEPLLDSELMELARWMSEYYVCPLGQVLAAMVPAGVKKGAGAKTEKYLHLTAEPQDTDQLTAGLRSPKQKRIVEHLYQNNAFDPGTAVELKQVLQTVGCTLAPVKKLTQQQIVTIARRTVLKALPAIPQSMAIMTEEVTLNADQQKAMTHFNSQISSNEFGVTLLHGVTDSGKTELYIRTIEAVMQTGRSAIVLLPEIALTTQTIQRFSGRFSRIAVMHSALTAAQRNDQWQKIRKCEADVVIGARSAVFAPLPNLGLIIVDEEHEPSYKQDTVPRYNARDVAVKRAQLANAHCILGTATPSLETLHNCKTRKHFQLVSLPKRVMQLPMPQMKLVDMRHIHHHGKTIDLISEPLARNLTSILEKKEQAILLLNRRGYSNFVFCPSCKHTLHCRNCDVTLTFHKSKPIEPGQMQTVAAKRMSYGHAVCHYCSAKTLVSKKCPVCGKGMAMIGTGSQRLEEEIARKFPNAELARIDSDSMAGKDYYRVLGAFGRGEIDILAGTQMLAKGLHFPNVTLVGIISADTSLYLPDFRANERTFQLISQVAGRTGRSKKKGVVFVQTFLPDQPAIQFALNNDYRGFVKEELKHRHACNLPPFWRMAVIIARDRDFEKLETACALIRERVDTIVSRHNLHAIVRGPIPAIISRIQRFHRMQIIVQAPTAEVIQRLFIQMRKAPPIRPAVKVAIDIDPINLL